LRRNPRMPTTEEQMRQIYLIMGIFFCAGGVVGMIIISLSG